VTQIRAREPKEAEGLDRRAELVELIGLSDKTVRAEREASDDVLIVLRRG
jgi:hypothetical protein